MGHAPDHSRAHPPAEMQPTDKDANEPGQRSGRGSGSVMAHMSNDAQRKTAPGGRSDVEVERTRHRVLVVDDSPAMRYATARALRAAGYQTVEAGAGAEALAQAAEVSAVILDVHLPDINGLEVCRLLRDAPGNARLPIVHMSAVYVTGEDEEASIAAGADAFLVAPVSPPHLTAVIDALIAGAVQAP